MSRERFEERQKGRKIYTQTTKQRNRILRYKFHNAIINHALLGLFYF
jgi:hypothetical protein